MRVRAAAVAAVMVGLMTAGCTDTDGPSTVDTSSLPTPGGTASSMTYEEAYRRLPIDGTKEVPITWDLTRAPETDKVLAARRALAFNYWMWGSTDYRPIIPVGRMLVTEITYEVILKGVADVTDHDPTTGPLRVKLMGVGDYGGSEVTVTFCTDRGRWRGPMNKGGKNRAYLESYEMKRVESGDGQPRWLYLALTADTEDLKARYGAECTKWAQHPAPTP
ncbi:hypothetical protein [Actinoplanes utahensis]|uniref:Lipoprotein n=1 Tax=Actinoplanes utahensis TaxID=1869 RepID=A0A0A6UK03_ACTUT|nr:hypothetical protein [Actinoplanes utahensis]KHD76445.1 hypothetical protein MB27_17215 [Actinoplanes utahensis]GIF29769.1 hypothetical protein Aut01nite_27550 [Actinoplanes utahensis]